MRDLEHRCEPFVPNLSRAGPIIREQPRRVATQNRPSAAPRSAVASAATVDSCFRIKQSDNNLDGFLGQPHVIHLRETGANSRPKAGAAR